MTESERTYRELYEAAYRDAHAFLYRAEQFSAQENPDTTLAFNIASMSLERYLTALCAKNGRNPFNHNFVSLMDMAERFVGFPRDVAERIRALDDIFGICSLDEYFHGEPSDGDAELALELCRTVEAMCLAPPRLEPSTVV